MTAPKKYLLDANILIEAKNRHYGFGICSGFWKILEAKHASGQVFSIQRVKAEIERGQDELNNWVSSLPKSFFQSESDLFVIGTFAPMMQWVQDSEHFLERAKTDFATDADGWLIAYAKAHGYVLVTHEAYDPNIKKKVPMPNVCKEFEVEYMNCFEMLRELEVDMVAEF